MTETESDLVGHWLYSTDLFDKQTIQRIARSFEVLLANVIEQPDARLSTIKLLTSEEELEIEADKKQRKQSQRKRLSTIQPEVVHLTQKY